MVKFLVRTRNSRALREKRQHVQVWIELGGVEIYRQESSDYGLSREDTVVKVENFLKTLRSGLSASGVDSAVIREEF